MSNYTDEERQVAAAICNARFGGSWAWVKSNEVERADFCHQARAALRALIPISDDMAHAAAQLGIADDMDCALIFKTMIDAASPVGSGGDNRP